MAGLIRISSIKTKRTLHHHFQYYFITYLFVKCTLCQRSKINPKKALKCNETTHTTFRSLCLIYSTFKMYLFNLQQRCDLYSIGISLNHCFYSIRCIFVLASVSTQFENGILDRWFALASGSTRFGALKMESLERINNWKMIAIKYKCEHMQWSNWNGTIPSTHSAFETMAHLKWPNTLNWIRCGPNYEQYSVQFIANDSYLKRK